MQIRFRDRSDLRRQMQQMSARGQHAFVNQVYADMNQYAPMLSSDMRNQSHIAPDNKSITYTAPYAARQFYNQMVNYTTPGTGPRWDEKAKGIHMESWKRVTEAAMRLL